MQARPFIAVADCPFPDLVPAQHVLGELNAEIQLAEQPTHDGILALARRADALLVTYAKITAAMISAMPRVQIISRMGLGVDNIDVAAASRAGIVVTRVAEYCTDEVSDHAMALLLALLRKVVLGNKVVQAGRWEMPAVAPIHRIRGTTLGLLGFGKIPQLVAPKAQAFGMKVIFYDPYVPDEVCRRLGVERVDLVGLFRLSDYISIHCPLNPETRHILNAEAFARMKTGVYIVNTARGPTMDEAALAAALDSGKVAGAALDVMEKEPPPADSLLFGRDNVLIQPHTGFYSVESLVELQTKAAQEVYRVLTGQPPLNPLNPEVLAAAGEASVLR
jgi:D-3-phosphoglycerate dehydrogenase